MNARAILDRLNRQRDAEARAESDALALASPVWRTLLEIRDGLDDDGMASLTLLWLAAGSPADRRPDHLYPPGDVVTNCTGGDPHVLGSAEHRPEGVFADWEVACWYAMDLDPKNIQPWHALDIAGY